MGYRANYWKYFKFGISWSHPNYYLYFVTLHTHGIKASSSIYILLLFWWRLNWAKYLESFYIVFCETLSSVTPQCVIHCFACHHHPCRSSNFIFRGVRLYNLFSVELSYLFGLHLIMMNFHCIGKKKIISYKIWLKNYFFIFIFRSAS